jgi:SAM-dependent methyltransferase
MFDYLNIGCGDSFHLRWENIDIAPLDPAVKAFDVRKGLPYSDNAFDAVYSSHVLEHLRKYEASFLLKQIHRVLRPGGVFRVAVPDLESIARTYIQELESITDGGKSSIADYEWIVLELLDQTVRSRPGGEMLRFLVDPDIENRDFVVSRVGQEAQKFWDPPKAQIEDVKLSHSQKIANFRSKWAKKIIKLLAGQNALDAFVEGLFRNSGEIHHWMYDRFSLKELLRIHEFHELEICTAYVSRIPNFDFFGLDVVNGKIRKPDSLFMEGIKRPA